MNAGRPRHRASPVRSPCLALALALLIAPPAKADTWYESYQKAEEALAKQRWSETVRHLNAALEQQPTSSANVRTYGMRFIQYFPYLKLGIAYDHLGQGDAALQAFETEERQGAIQQSAAGSALLRTYRERIQRQQTEQEAERQRRAQAVLPDSLAEARALEDQGRLEDALATLDKALAVAPDNAPAQEARRRLLTRIAERQRQQQEAERFARLLRQGSAELAAGHYRIAAASFSEALALRRDDEAASLLAQAQDRLRAEIGGRQDEAERQRIIIRSLARAAELDGTGEHAAALTELQAALALDPRHAAARALQQRIIHAQAAAEEAGTKATAVGQLLTEAASLLAAGDYEQALRTANRVLVLEPANPAALQHLTQAYARLSDALLTPDEAPPVILLDDDRPGDAAAAAIALVRSPLLVLTGNVYDRTPIELQVLDQGRPVGQAAVRPRELQGIWITDFEWRHRLAPGTSTVEIVATDQAGNRATLRYQVEYVVPFVRSLWFPASIAAGCAAVVAGGAGLRVRRRRKLLRGRFNPYVAGAPILEHARFFGRQQLLDYVLRRVCNNSIMLYGERRIGKTSFQHQLKRCLATLEDPDHEFYPVYIDLQGTPQEKFFGTLAAEVFHELAPKLDGLLPPTALGQDAYGYPELVKDIQRVLKALRGRTAKKVKLVLLIDEVDELNDYDPRINQRLRSLFMRAFADSLVSVVSGVAIKKHWEREGSPWYNFFQEIEIKPLDRDEARSLIEAPVRGIFTFEDGVADAIMQRTGCKPYLMQRLCSGLVDRMHEERRRRITVADVEAACQVERL